MSDPLITALELGLKSAPNNPDILIALAEAYEKAAQPDKALTTLQELIALDAGHQQALNKAISLAMSLEQPVLVQAYQALLSATQQVGDDTDGVQGAPGANIEAVTPESSANHTTSEVPRRVRGTPLKLVAENGDSQETDEIEVEDSHIYLDDVGGMETVKRRLRLSFLAPLQNQELVKQYGKAIGGGLLLYGPPGCGKTFIARALAGELGAKFISVGLSDVLDMYVGESERKLHEIFESARRSAPTVLFFDELDALGQKRSQLKTSGMRTLVNQLLNEMDSVNSSNENLFILAATNHPWDIDVALKRPGRFDRMVAVFPPDFEARKSILAYHLAKSPTEHLDLDYLARQTEHFSGADLKHLCQSAVESVFERSLETQVVEPVSTDDFTAVLKEVRPSTRGWFESARNYAMFANQDGQYNDLNEYIRQNKL